METIAPRRPLFPERLLSLTKAAPVAPLALLLLAMALGGLGLNVLGRSSSMPATPATVIETEAAEVPAGDLPRPDPGPDDLVVEPPVRRQPRLAQQPRRPADDADRPDGR